nr:MAG: RNA-dependent RNA polymerase [Botourmiaviridae sp.]
MATTGRKTIKSSPGSWPSLGPTERKLLTDLAPTSVGIAALTPQGEVNHCQKTNQRKPALGSGEGHTFASLSAPAFACRAAGATKMKHRGCFAGGATVQNLPSAPFWVDSDPCPAVRPMLDRRAKRQDKEKKRKVDPDLGWDRYVHVSGPPKWKNKGKEENIVEPRVERGTYVDFPYRGAHHFRDRLYDKRMSLDVDNVIESASQYLGRLFYTLDPVPSGPFDDQAQTKCGRVKELRRKARAIVRLLRDDQKLKAVHPLPSVITCGGLRSSVRSMYSPVLTVAQELSIKTSAKADGQPCSYCEDLQADLVEQWKKKRLQPQNVDQQHLIKFKEAFARNVPEGWDSGKEHVVFVPNGHATNCHSRRQGGNWNRQDFDREPEVKLVMSAGKPRIVTLYSSFNSQVLKPLHDRLYAVLKRKGWLLVGSPTRERLEHLAAGCLGTNWLSFDYSSATDNIKLEYVRAMIDVLKQKSVGMSIDEANCLDVLGDLSLDGELADSGQPMGSLMSFPLLCLANKTVVDLALTQLLESGHIRFKEWTGHRCLINGDDLLTRDVSSGNLVEAIESQGSKLGLVVNREKTMVSPEYGEINSTVFKNCIEQKKTNVSALWMGADVTDVLGFAKEATTTPRGFRAVVLANASRLARQKIKTAHRLPGLLIKTILSSSRLKHAICATPSSKVPELTNLFPVVPLPDGYDLSREEEVAVLRREVDRARDERRWVGLAQEKKRLTKKRKETKASPGERLPGRKIFKMLQPKPTIPVETTLLCFAKEWEKKRKEALRADSVYNDPPIIVSDLSGIDRLVDAIKYWKKERVGVRAPWVPAHEAPVLWVSDPVTDVTM